VVAPPPIAIEGVTIDVVSPPLVAIEGVNIDVVALPPIAIEGVHWAKDGPKFVCKVDGCDASYTTKYNLIQHLQTHHNVTMELSKLEHPSTWEQGLKVQGHAAMNAHVLSNPLAQFCRNEQKVIAKARKHITLEWDKLQGDL
jgi:hypothetical protein